MMRLFAGLALIAAGADALTSHGSMLDPICPEVGFSYLSIATGDRGDICRPSQTNNNNHRCPVGCSNVGGSPWCKVTGTADIPCTGSGSLSGGFEASDANLQRSASSRHVSGGCQDGTLNSASAWCAATNDNPMDFYQISLKGRSKVYGLATKGRAGCDACNQYIKKLKVFATDENGDHLVGEFDANTDMHSTKLIRFETPVVATAIKIVPTSWNNHKSMRASLFVGSAEELTGPSTAGLPGAEHLHLYYTAANYDTESQVWADASGNHHDGMTVSGTPTKSSDPAGSNGNMSPSPLQFVRGGTNDGIRFPHGSIPKYFTMCTLSRYDGPTKGRIFDAADSGSNWLHAHWGGNTGVVHYGPSGWKTGSSNPTPFDGWVVVCASNEAGSPVLVNGQDLSVGNVAGPGNRRLTINAGTYTGERSDWAVADVLIYRTQLSAAQMQQVSAFLIGRTTASPTVAPTVEPTAAPTTGEFYAEQMTLADLSAHEWTTGTDGDDFYKCHDYQGCQVSRMGSRDSFDLADRPGGVDFSPATSYTTQDGVFSVDGEKITFTYVNGDSHTFPYGCTC